MEETSASRPIALWSGCQTAIDKPEPDDGDNDANINPATLTGHNAAADKTNALQCPEQPKDKYDDSRNEKGQANSGCFHASSFVSILHPCVVARSERAASHATSAICTRRRPAGSSYTCWASAASRQCLKRCLRARVRSSIPRTRTWSDGQPAATSRHKIINGLRSHRPLPSWPLGV